MATELTPFPLIGIATTVAELPGACARHTRRVYAMKFSDRLVKIGMTGNVAQRATSIATDHARFGIPSNIECAAYSPECYNASKVEKHLLDSFDRVHGEYVEADFESVLAAMSSAPYDLMTEEQQAARDAQSEATLIGLKKLLRSMSPPPAQPAEEPIEVTLAKSILTIAQQTETLNRLRDAKVAEITALLFEAYDNSDDAAMVEDIILTCAQKVATLGGSTKAKVYPAPLGGGLN